MYQYFIPCDDWVNDQLCVGSMIKKTLTLSIKEMITVKDTLLGISLKILPITLKTCSLSHSPLSEALLEVLVPEYLRLHCHKCFEVNMKRLPFTVISTLKKSRSCTVPDLIDKWMRTYWSTMTGLLSIACTGQQHSLYFLSHLVKTLMKKEFQNCCRE